MTYKIMVVATSAKWINEKNLACHIAQCLDRPKYGVWAVFGAVCWPSKHHLYHDKYMHDISSSYHFCRLFCKWI